MGIKVGSKWICTDARYPAFGQTCQVLEVHDHPDFNGDGEIEVRYEDGTTADMKVRKFSMRHDLVQA